MKHYHVLIDNDISSKTFTFDELINYGLLDDYDEHIKVKATDETMWQVAREYPFYFSEKANPNFVVNEDGTVTRKNGADSSRREPPSELNQNTGNGSTRTTNSSSSPSSKNDNGCIWAILIAIGIAILSAIIK